MGTEHARIVLYCGLARLIPLPFLDDWAERRFTRRLLAALAHDRGVTLPDEALDVLTEDRSSMVAGCLVTAVVWPLKKLFRTVLYFLTVKDVVDAVTRAAHRASMVQIALDEGRLPQQAAEVRVLMDTLLSRFRVSPVSRTLWLQPRPTLPDPPPPSRLVGVLRWLQRHGAGGLLLPEFRARLAEVPS